MKQSYTLDRTLSHLKEGIRHLQAIKSEIDELRHNSLEEASDLVWEVLKSADYEVLRREDRELPPK